MNAGNCPFFFGCSSVGWWSDDDDWRVCCVRPALGKARAETKRVCTYVSNAFSFHFSIFNFVSCWKLLALVEHTELRLCVSVCGGTGGGTPCGCVLKTNCINNHSDCCNYAVFLIPPLLIRFQIYNCVRISCSVLHYESNLIEFKISHLSYWLWHATSASLIDSPLWQMFLVA